MRTQGGMLLQRWGPMPLQIGSALALRQAQGERMTADPLVVSLSNHERENAEPSPFDRLRASGGPADPLVVSLSNHER